MIRIFWINIFQFIGFYSCSFEKRWHLKCNHLSRGCRVPCLDSDYYELWTIIFLCYLYLFYNFLSQQKCFICWFVATKFYMIKIPSLVAIPYARRSEFRIDHPWVELVGLWHSLNSRLLDTSARALHCALCVPGSISKHDKHHWTRMNISILLHANWFDRCPNCEVGPPPITVGMI